MEYSYKYTPDRFRRLAETAGFRPEKMWTDEDELFSIWFLTVEG
ncbi:MAG: L-histidine N(alpha)-methyltransferase [Bradymonadaceae bacterium]